MLANNLPGHEPWAFYWQFDNNSTVFVSNTSLKSSFPLDGWSWKLVPKNSFTGASAKACTACATLSGTVSLELDKSKTLQPLPKPEVISGSNSCPLSTCTHCTTDADCPTGSYCKNYPQKKPPYCCQEIHDGATPGSMGSTKHHTLWLVIGIIFGVLICLGLIILYIRSFK